VLQQIIAQEDETVEVGATLAVIGDSAEAPAPAEQPQPEQQEQAAAQPEPAARPEAAPQPTASGSGEGTEITMPALGESVTEGTITRWLKKEGDTVEVDEPLLEVSTDKVDTEIPSPRSEERRAGKECRTRWTPPDQQK